MHDAGFGHGVTCVGDDAQIGLRPGAGQVHGDLRRRHHVVAAMHDHARDWLETVCRPRSADRRHRRSRHGRSSGTRCGRRRGRRRPPRSGARAPDRAGAISVLPSHTLQARAASSCTSAIGTGQPPVIGCDQVAALARRDRAQIILQRVGEDPAAAFLVEPFELGAAQREDAAQHELGRPAQDESRHRPARASSPRSRRTPASARCRGARAAVRCRRRDPRWCSPRVLACGRRAAAAALVEQHDAVA